VFGLAGNDSEAVLKGGRGNHGVRRAQWPSGQLAYSVKPAPSRRNRMRDGQNTSRKEHRQMAFKRRLQTRPPSDILHGRETARQQREAVSVNPLRATVGG
jgi:hypothetical protein